MPCVEEVCVGDDAKDLAHVPWEQATVPATDVPLGQGRVPEDYLSRLRMVLRGERDAILAVAPYWLLRRLDASGLTALSGIRAVCETMNLNDRLEATYFSQPGHRTVVSFEPVASDDGRIQRFLVAAIHRYIEGVHDHPQLKAIGKAFSDRYQGLPLYASATDAAAAWIVTAARGAHLRLLAPIGDSVQRDINLRKHPECPASASAAPALP
jgi:hypothetical protein